MPIEVCSTFCSKEPLYGHSPSSWKEMWKDVFTELESLEYFETHVVVEAELLVSCALLVFVIRKCGSPQFR